MALDTNMLEELHLSEASATERIAEITRNVFATMVMMNVVNACPLPLTLLTPMAQEDCIIDQLSRMLSPSLR